MRHDTTSEYSRKSKPKKHVLMKSKDLLMSIIYNALIKNWNV